MKKEIQTFNKLFEEFLEKIIAQFDYPKLKIYRRAFLLLKETSPQTPVNIFMSGCVNYKNEIKERNETFFLKDETITKNLQNLQNFSKDCGLDVYWKELSIATKKAIWDYIQSLFVLGEIIVNKDKKQFDKYNSLYLSEYKEELSNLDNGFSINFLNKLNS